jgi:hypothetical protein
MHNRRLFLQRSGMAAGALALPELLSGGADATLSAWSQELPAAGPSGPDLPLVVRVELQPLVAHVQRLAAAMESTGWPLPAADRDALHRDT